LKNIILFGASEFGRKAYDFYHNDTNVKIIAFCDNDFNKHHRKFLDIKVISAQEIEKKVFDEIIICSSYDNEIKTQLLGMNIDKSRIKLFATNTANAHLQDGQKMFIAKELMFFITDLFNSHNIKYHIDHGTLLGIIRDKKILPWDIDIDIAILDTELNSVLSILEKYLQDYNSKYCIDNKWNYKLHHIKMKLKKENNFPMVIKIFNESEDLISKNFSLDIELKHQFQENLYWMIGSRKLKVPISICFQTEDLEFEKRQLKIPNDSNAYLKALYGDWKIPVKEWTYEQYTNIEEE
jgi:phosphorylcholine metabolism protein LicD